jgi:hypothetical protein
MLVTMATTTTLTGSKMGHLLIGAVGIGSSWVFCLASGGLSGVYWFPLKKSFLRDALGLPLAPLGAWAIPVPVWAAGGLRFSHS